MVANSDRTLPASHTIDIRFGLPANFPGGGVKTVPGILLKQTGDARGVPLTGLAVKVTKNVILMGLSALESDMQRNMQLLQGRQWFDVPIVFESGSRAIITLEKGASGERAFREGFAAWDRSKAAVKGGAPG
jgi:hypothetical protein